MIFSHHDIVHSSLFDNFIINRYINHKLIRYTKNLSYQSKSIEINYILYNKYISFPKYIVDSVNKYTFQMRNEYKIGLQMRLGDDCILGNCKIKKGFIREIKKELDIFNRSNYILFCISDSNKNISRYFNHSVFIFKSQIKPWHSGKISNVKYKKQQIEKLIGDIIFFSTSQVFLISPYSTYGLLGFHLGAFSNKIIKSHKIIGSNKNNIYDIFKLVDVNNKIYRNCRNHF